jgi:hypothetical protein
MSSRSTLVRVVCVLATFAAATEATDAAAAGPAAMETGVVLDRLSHEQLRQWRSIEHLVDASAPNGTPLYPTLSGLWEWALQSGNAIYIELASPDCGAKGTAGRFLIERFDPGASRHVGVIRLCLANIDRRPTFGGGTRANGFVRLAGLRKRERYAEVLGHELAHAAYAFASPERARMVYERVETVSAQFMAHRAEHGNEPLEPALLRRLEQRDALLEELEAHADAIELLVWRELAKSRSSSASDHSRRPPRADTER